MRTQTGLRIWRSAIARTACGIVAENRAGCRVAGARLRLTDEVTAFTQERNDLALNGRGLFPAQRLYGPECVRAKGEVAELGRRLGCSCQNRNRLLVFRSTDRMRLLPRELVPASARVSPDPTRHKKARDTQREGRRLWHPSQNAL